ncbi:MAG: Hpt domain-containing protein [Pseudomonadales bacterium]|nr:Hpt domain-containing protein [Pseudomonadales bacterium]
MDLDNNELWNAFVDEVSEQLEMLEAQLLADEKSSNQHEESIHQIFRYFHSIKSSCALFDFSCMEEIAHAAENILDSIRNHLRDLNPQIIDILLRSVDALAQQLQYAQTHLQAPPKNQDILTLLNKTLASDTTNEQSETDNRPASLADNNTVLVPNVVAIESEDMEEFAEMTSFVLLKFYRALADKSTSTALKPLLSLQQIAKRYELTVFVRLLSALEGYAKNPLEDPSELFSLSVSLMEQLNTLEHVSEQSFSLTALYDYFFQRYNSDAKLCIHKFQTEIDKILTLNNGHDTVDSPLWQAFILQQDDVIKYMKLFGLQHCSHLYQYHKQLLLKQLIKKQGLNGDQLQGLLQHVQCLLLAMQDIDELRQMDEKTTGSLQSFRQQMFDDEKRHSRINRFTQLLKLDECCLDYVSNKMLDIIQEKTQLKQCFCEITVNMEKNRGWARDFFHWAEQTQIVTSRTVLCDIDDDDAEKGQYSLTSFLLFIDDNETSILASIKAMDADNRYIIHTEIIQYQDSINHVIESKSVLLEEQAAIQNSAVVPQDTELTSAKTIRINSDVIDRFVSQVGEMVLQRNTVNHALSDNIISKQLNACQQLVTQFESNTVSKDDILQIKQMISNACEGMQELSTKMSKLSAAVDYVQNDVMTLRVVPISIVFNRLPRVVRSINQDQGKDIHIELVGEQVRIDKGMVDLLMEPLLHIIRNCADHGIESALDRKAAGKTERSSIKVSAEQHGNQLLIQIEDDGRGLDYEKIQRMGKEKGLLNVQHQASISQLNALIFHPGFSTRDTITETSGRGVGMDVVKKRLCALGGNIELRSEAGVGTCFSLTLPVSVAIQGVILFKHQGETLAIPERNIVLGLTLKNSDIQTVQGQPAFVYQEQAIPLYCIDELFHWSKTAQIQSVLENQQVIIVSQSGFCIGIKVDQLLDRQEIFVRDIDNALMNLPGVGGASILGNGEVAIILNIEDAIRILQKESVLKKDQEVLTT